MYISSTVGTFNRSLILLAPPRSTAWRSFRNTSRDYSLYRDFQTGMQRLRGRLYLEDGAIAQTDLASDGRHVLETDEHSWHLLTLDTHGEVVGCIRYLQHPRGVRFDDLNARDAALADSNQWGARLRSAVEDELAQARGARFSYVEVGGWAMAPEVRGTTECVRSLLATYAWSRIAGGALGLCTATERNHSASILQRIGGRPIQWDGAALPAYYEPRFNCRMQMLSFDSRYPNPKYQSAIEDIRHGLLNVPLIYPERAYPEKTCAEKKTWQAIVHGFAPGAAPSFIPNRPVVQIA